MRILIVSDTHRRDENLKEVIRRTGPLDMLIHLGDTGGSEHAIVTWVSEDYDLEIILGNNDFFLCLDKEKELVIGRYKTLLTHEHYYNVSVGTEYLKREARARDFDIVMFGHTHRPFYEVEKEEGDRDLIVLNPGNLSYPHQDGHKSSFMLMKIDKEGEAHFSLNFL